MKVRASASSVASSEAGGMRGAAAGSDMPIHGVLDGSSGT